MQADLSLLPLFRGLSTEEIEELLSKLVFQRKSYPPGSLIASQGEECNRLLIIEEGAVKGEMIGPSGKSLKIEDMLAPTALAPAFIFGKQNKFPVNVLSTSPMKLIVIPRNELLKMFGLDARVLQNFLSMISSRAQFLSEKLRLHSFKSLKSKLAFYLINEAGNKTSFKLKHSQNELADLFGVARPSVGRAFLHLQNEGIIDIRYKQVEIRNVTKLHDAYSD